MKSLRIGCQLYLYTITRNHASNMEEFLEELKIRDVELTETRKVDKKTGEETVGWSYKSHDTYGKSKRKRRHRASNLADDLTREGIEAYFEEKQRELEAQNRPDEQLAKLREDVDAARREFHASKEALDTLQSPCPGLLAGMHVFAKAGRNAKDPVSRMMADMTAMMLRMMIQQVLAEERRKQRKEAEKRVYESRKNMWDAEKRLKAAEKALSNEDEREEHLKRERMPRRIEESERRVGVRTPRSADKGTQFGE